MTTMTTANYAGYGQLGQLYKERPPEDAYKGRDAPKSKRAHRPFCCWWSPELPGWMAEPVLCGASRAVVLWGGNAIACVFHLFMAFYVLGRSMGLDNWDVYGGVLLPVYRSTLLFTLNEEGEGSTGWQLIPKYVTAKEEQQTLNLTALTIAFFGLSAFFHFLVCAISVRWTLYYWWIDGCRNPLRWVEYSISASLMAVIIAFFAGIRSNHLLLALFFLSFSTICFGWVCEALSRPDAASRAVGVNADGSVRYGVDPLARTRHTRWEIGDAHRELLVAGCLPLPTGLLAAMQRLGPHVLGWVPYVVLWAIVWDNFVYATDQPNGKPPDFVYVIIWAEISIFSIFAVVQIVQQSSDWGCRNYWLGECAYIVLSVLAKGLLGIVLLANILLVSADVDQALRDAMAAEGTEGTVQASAGP